MNLFDLETNAELREQILKYFMSSVMTDSERAKLFNLPKNCRIREGAKIISPENLIIGENVWIGENAILDASGGLEIGENTQIGLGVYIWSHDSYKSAIMGLNTKKDKKGIIHKKTQIGNNCFIGGPSVIMPGVTIGDKCVIAPMSVVYNDIPSKTIYKPYSDILNTIVEKDNSIQELNIRVKVLEDFLTIHSKAFGKPV
jgi:acetyltransferase-like isoleucine patch superfamily enzyme